MTKNNSTTITLEAYQRLNADDRLALPGDVLAALADKAQETEEAIQPRPGFAVIPGRTLAPRDALTQPSSPRQPKRPKRRDVEVKHTSYRCESIEHHAVRVVAAPRCRGLRPHKVRLAYAQNFAEHGTSDWYSHWQTILDDEDDDIAMPVDIYFAMNSTDA